MSIVRRRLIPSAVIALSQVRWPWRRRPRRVELYVAFDDPCSAVALLDLERRLACELVVLPVVRRGIDGDPAVADKRRYAIADARRRARRLGLELARTEPLAPQACASLAAGAMAVPAAQRTAFCAATMRRLWFGGDEPEGVAAGDEGAVARNERRMRRRGPYDTPAAVVGHRWFFAHDRGAQIAEAVAR